LPGWVSPVSPAGSRISLSLSAVVALFGSPFLVLYQQLDHHPHHLLLQRMVLEYVLFSQLLPSEEPQVLPSFPDMWFVKVLQ
jgi:hypothetical protein